MKPRGSYEKREPKEYDERVIEIARVSRVAKGGRRIRFRALVVIGNHNGKVGMGIAKATEVAEAVKKAVAQAKKHIIIVPIINGTIPHEMNVKHGGARVMFKPATPGTSIVAGGSVRFVAELAGITDLLAKSMGSSNKINNVTATLKAFESFNPEIVEKIRNYAKKSEAKHVRSSEETNTDAPVLKEDVQTEKPVKVVASKEKPETKPKKAAKTQVEKK